MYLVQSPPKNTENVSKIFSVVVVALEEQIFHISSLISNSPKLESLQVLEPPNSNSNNNGKNSFVLGFWSLELHSGHTSHAGKAASSGSSVFQSIFTLNYRNSAHEEYRGKKTHHLCKVKQGFQLVHFILLQPLSPSHFNSLTINSIDSIRNYQSY